MISRRTDLCVRALKFVLPCAAVFLVHSPLHAEQPPTVAEEHAALRLADPALRIELVASEPAVVSPVAMAWDERGRLFVAEMSDYPVAPTGGRIKLLEDRDGDGRFEHATVFAEGLPYPNGVLPWNGGVLVTAAPNLLYLKDQDGDGRADEKRVVLTGFGEGNQQLRVNSPTWGLDNWVYLANGRSGGAVRRPEDPPGKAVPIPRNDLKVRPQTGVFEPVAGFSQFGLPRDDWGDRFPSWNTVPLRHVVLEIRPGADSTAGSRSVADILDLSDGGRVYSLAPQQKRFNAETVTFFNATCGPTIYRGDLLGAAYLGHAFVCEPLTGVVHHRVLEPAGPTFVARRVERGREFLASTHAWFRPVNLATGPDGALYVADFCRAWVEHPAFVPEALRNSVDFREGHDRGRIWRIVPTGRTPQAVPLADTTAALVAALESPNGWARDTAQRLLVERKDLSAIAGLRALVRGSARPVGRVHALWTLEGMNALDPETLHAAFGDGDAHVREQAARLGGSRMKDHIADLVPLADDPSVRVRLRAAVALGTVDDDRARDALARIAARDADSPWTAQAILEGLGTNPLGFLATLSARQPEWLTRPTATQARFLARLASLTGARNEEGELITLLRRIAETPGQAAQIALLQGLVQGQAAAPKPRIRWLAGPTDSLSGELSRIARVRDAAVTVTGAENEPAWLRVLALAVTLECQPAAARGLLTRLLDPGQPVELQTAAARGLSKVAEPELVVRILDGWDHASLGTRRVLLGSLSSTPALAAQLVNAVAAGTVPAAEIDPATREALKRVADRPVQERISTLFKAQEPNADRRSVIARYEPALHEKADPARGPALFAKNCQTCHARNGQGAKVGPDLISVAGRPADDLLVAILDPSREVAPDGLSVVVVTHEGRTLTGLLAEETPAAVRLRRAEGLEDVVPRTDIEAIRPTGRSLMPDGLEQALTPQDLADLIAFLRRPETKE
ncbi:MAG: c-type cytochrome [Isosphaeraceae bacterium]|nr:c-type cytochrome [Isosphaeraceae bacterium]